MYRVDLVIRNGLFERKLGVEFCEYAKCDLRIQLNANCVASVSLILN